MVLSTAYVARGVVILIYYIFDVICLLSYGHLMTEMNRLELCACVREEEAICLGVWCVCVSELCKERRMLDQCRTVCVCVCVYGWQM